MGALGAALGASLALAPIRAAAAERLTPRVERWYRRMRRRPIVAGYFNRRTSVPVRMRGLIVADDPMIGGAAGCGLRAADWAVDE